MPRLERDRVVSAEARAALGAEIRHLFDTGAGEEPPPRVPAEKLVAAADELGLAGHLNRAVKQAQPCDQYLETVKGLLRPVFMKHTAAMLEATRAAEAAALALTAAQVPYVMYKGPFLSEQLYGDATLRRSGDIDIILPRGRYHLEAAKAALGKLGYRHPAVHGKLLEYFETEGNELPLATEGKPVVDIHHGQYDDLPEGAFLEIGTRAEEVPCGEGGCQRLSDIDALMLLSCHYWTVPRAQSLRWLVDCAALFRKESVFRHRWVELVRRWGFGFYIMATMRAVQHTFGVIPASPGLRYLDEELAEGERAVCDRIAMGGPENLPDGLVQMVHRMRMPLGRRVGLIRKYLWPHPGRILLNRTGPGNAVGLSQRCSFAVKRLIRALRTR